MTSFLRFCSALTSMKSMGHYNLGAGKLPFSVYGSRSSFNSVVSGSLWTLSDGCMPIIFASYSNHNTSAYFSASVWTNMKLSFNSSVVFQPPQYCPNPTSSKRHNIVSYLFNKILIPIAVKFLS